MRRDRHRSWILVLAGSVLLGTACVARGPVRTPGVADEEFALAIERGRNIVRPLVRRGSGVAVAVGVDGRLVWSEGFGKTALTGGEPVRPETPFRIYSLMKQVTAVLALQAAVAGEVDLGASVRRVLPGLPARYEPVTPLQLLTHTAGVRHYRDRSEASPTEPCATAAEALPRFVDDPLVGEPGVTESYSTWGFVLASAVLERAAGLPFDDLLEQRILRPAGMTSTFPDRPSEHGTRLIHYDVGDDGRIRETPPVENSCKMGGGGFLASAEDVVRFHNAVMRGELLPMPAVEQLLGGRRTLEAGGSGPGGHAVSRVDLDSRVSVVIASNTSGLEQEIALERARELLAAIFSSPQDP